MWISRQLTIEIRQWASTLFKTWHIRYDWSFTPFVVVVGGKYFLPVPDCLLFGRNSINSSSGNF